MSGISAGTGFCSQFLGLGCVCSPLRLERMKSINRAWLGWFVRIVFTIFAVWFLATKLNWGEFAQIVRVADPR